MGSCPLLSQKMTSCHPFRRHPVHPIRQQQVLPSVCSASAGGSQWSPSAADRSCRASRRQPPCPSHMPFAPALARHGAEPSTGSGRPGGGSGTGGSSGGGGGAGSGNWGGSGEHGDGSRGHHPAYAALAATALAVAWLWSDLVSAAPAAAAAAGAQHHRVMLPEVTAGSKPCSSTSSTNSSSLPGSVSSSSSKCGSQGSDGGSNTGSLHEAPAQHGAAQEAGAGELPVPAAATPNRIVMFIEPSPFTYLSGYQTRFLATIKELTAAGCKVLVVTPGRGAAGLPGGDAQPADFAGAKVVEAGSFPCPGYGTVPLSLGLSPRIWGEVKDWRPDVIHVTSPGALPVAAWLYSRMLRVPLVASYHTHVPSYLPRLGLDWLAGGMWGVIRTIHRAADLTIAVSPKTATDLVSAGACDSRAVKVWPKAVDCELFHPKRASPSMRARLAGADAAAAAVNDGSSSSSTGGCSSSSSQPLLLYVGRVSPEKNVQLLLPVLQQVPGARLAIVGDGPALEDMQTLFRGTPTVFTGKLSGTELAAAYASADVFVMPSETETLGNVVGEAMASGLPVVAAAAGGVPSFISRPGHTGLLFPPGDATTAAALVRSLLAEDGHRRAMSLAARADMERYSWRSATLEILREHYPAAITNNNGANLA